MSGDKITASERQLADAFERVRRELDAVHRAAGLDPDVPQDVARRLGINRNLTWKFSRVICGTDLHDAMSHMPSREGVRILLIAAERAGVAAGPIAAVRAAHDEFVRVIEAHAGDRPTLDLMLDNLGGEGVRLEQSRKLAFRGNSGLWGAQARGRVATMLLAPSAANPDELDTAMTAGIVDFRRLRPGVRWPMFSPTWHGGDDDPRPIDLIDEAMDPSMAGTPGPKLIADFCEPGVPELGLVKTPLGWLYELADGPVGKAGSMTVYFGLYTHGGGTRYRTADDRYGDLFTNITMPVEHLQFDMVFHRDLSFVRAAEAFVRGNLGVPGAPPQTLPFGLRPELVAETAVGLRSELCPRYAELIDRALRGMGHRPEDFAVLRVEMAYPPMHASVGMRFELPER